MDTHVRASKHAVLACAGCFPLTGWHVVSPSDTPTSCLSSMAPHKWVGLSICEAAAIRRTQSAERIPFVGLVTTQITFQVDVV